MINDLPKQTAPDDLQSDVLKAAEQKLESNLTPKVRADYDKILVAGLKLALDKGPNGIAASLKQSQDPIKDIVTGAINIVGLLGMQSRGTMPIKAAVPATMALIIHGLAFAQKSGIMQVGNDQLTQAAKLFGNMITHKFGISPEMIKTAANNLHKITQDPGNMDKLHYAAGMKKAPDATQAIPLQPSAPGGAAP